VLSGSPKIGKGRWRNSEARWPPGPGRESGI
jgi:hypothetical protein